MAQLREACQHKGIPTHGIKAVQTMYALNESLPGLGKEEARTLLNKSFDYIRASQS